MSMMTAMRGTFLVFFSLFAVVEQARAGLPQTFDLSEGTISYKLVHKLHEVVGTSHLLEGKARFQSDGSLQVQVRAKVATFDSGNSNRDEHMREVTREASHPYVSVRGTLAGLRLPLASPETLSLHATVELNGEKQSMDIPCELTSSGAGLRAKFIFPVSLDAMKIDRPELLFVKVDDAVNIQGDILLVPSP